VLGGSSSINGTKYVRGAPHDFDRWAKTCGNAGGWSANEILPIFREIETSDQTGPLRGRSGPLHVRTVTRPHAITQAFVKSACAAGHPLNRDYNGSQQEGVAYAQFSQRRGLRCSAADAFLKPVLGQDNVTLLLDAFVERIEISGGRAMAVFIRHRETLHRETAREIVLCAGAINSPKLLMLSGIGERRELERHDIPVVLDVPAVGRHFKDQPFLRMTYRTKIPTHNLTRGPLQKLAIAAEFILHGEGPISNLFEAVAFLKSSPAELVPDIRLTFLALGLEKMADGSSRMAPYPAVMVSLMTSYPKGTGRIGLTSKDPRAPPSIDYPLFADPADLDTMVRGIHAIRRIMSAEPMASLVEREITPGGTIDSPSALEEFVRQNAGISYHSIGTCRMGAGHDTVVDPDLRVRGIENLWVADASIMPEHISADTNATCMMIGAKLGRQLAQEPGAPRMPDREEINSSPAASSIVSNVAARISELGPSLTSIAT
jgi:choline dehydrogenase-like flavoprotein